MDDAMKASADHVRFDTKYQHETEPWDYSLRASERSRYDFLFETAASLIRDRSANVGDVGCSLGLLSERLTTLSDHVAAVDLSPTAAKKTLERCGGKIEAASASATSLPFASGSMQLLILADGLVSWGLTRAQQEAAVAEAHRALAPDGHAMFMEYLNPRAHAAFLEPIAARFDFTRVAYLDDRLWWVLESVFRALRGTGLYNAFASSQAWAQLLAAVSKMAGPRGSKHLCVVASPKR